MENMDISSLKEELYSIHSSTDGLAEIEKDSKIVDLKDVGDMLVKVQRQMEDLTKSKSLFGRITDNIPILGKLKKSAEKELALQREITDYVTSTLSNFERKYEDLIAYLKTFEVTKAGFSEDVVKLDQWIEKATAYEATLTNSVDKLALERLMPEDAKFVYVTNNLGKDKILDLLDKCPKGFLPIYDLGFNIIVER